MKRVLDLLCAVVASILLFPLCLIIALLIAVTNGFPIIFAQERVGRNNQLFRVYKFRTMKNGTRNTASADLTEASQQITKVGAFLRKTSLDELPQLLNILKGDMSLVGPRPLIPQEEAIRALRAQANVYSVRPGITGWAQVNGRDRLSDAQKVEYDRYYVENQSLGFDFKILFKTFFNVLSAKDIVEGDEK